MEYSFEVRLWNPKTHGGSVISITTLPRAVCLSGEGSMIYRWLVILCIPGCADRYLGLSIFLSSKSISLSTLFVLPAIPPSLGWLEGDPVTYYPFRQPAWISLSICLLSLSLVRFPVICLSVYLSVSSCRYCYYTEWLYRMLLKQTDSINSYSSSTHAW